MDNQGTSTTAVPSKMSSTEEQSKSTLPLPQHPVENLPATGSGCCSKDQSIAIATTDIKQRATSSASDANKQPDSTASPKATEQSSSPLGINVPLIPLKIILFCWYAAGACLLPYMTLHMKQLGLTMVETTAVYAILPIIQLFGTPLAGFLADKTGNYKSVLQLTLGVCIFTTLLIQYVVPGRKPKDPAAEILRTSSPIIEDDDEIDPFYMITFWLYLGIRICHQVAVGLTYVLLDTTTMVLANQHDSNYGRQRFWAILATGIFSPICGFVIDNISTHHDVAGNKITNFDPAFFLFEGLTALSLFKVSMISVEISELPKNVWGNIRPLLKCANIWVFLISVFIMGSCWGFLESFLFIHLDNLKAPNYLLGLTVTVGAFSGLPFLYGSGWFVKKFGAIQLLQLALLVYAVRLFGYSYLNDYWWCLPYEMMEIFTLHLMWVSTVQVAYEIAPPGMLATLQAVVGGLNFGVGRGFGSLVGGAVLVVYDIRTSFRVMGAMALVTAILYILLQRYVLAPLTVNKERSSMSKSRRRQSSKDIEDGLAVAS